MSIIRNAKEFFGLAPHDDAYFADDVDYGTEGAAAYAPRSSYARDYRDYEAPEYDRAYGDYPAEEEPRRGYYAPESRAVSRGSSAPVSSRHSLAHDVPPVFVDLVSYRDAKQVGAPFRDGEPVVFEVSEMETGEAKRVIDFAAGLCFALGGDMKKLDGRVFALIPSGSSVSTVELERAAKLR